MKCLGNMEKHDRGTMQKNGFLAPWHQAATLAALGFLASNYFTVVSHGPFNPPICTKQYREGNAALRNIMTVVLRTFCSSVNTTQRVKTRVSSRLEAGFNGKPDRISWLKNFWCWKLKAFFEKEKEEQKNERCGCGVTSMLCTFTV